MSSRKSKSVKSLEKKQKKEAKEKIKPIDLTIPDAWINELALLHVDDDNWRCSVFVIEVDVSDMSVYLDHFHEFAKKGDRLAISVISKVDVIQYIVKTMRDSGKGSAPCGLLCSEIFRLCGPNFDGNIPTPLLGSVIKYIIIDLKTKNKAIRNGLNERKKAFDDYQNSLWQISKAGKSASSKAPTAVSSKSKDKSEKFAKSFKGASKAFTKLRKRGEEWKDVKWVDDAPVKGPQLFVVVSNFFDSDLPLELISLKVPLSGVVNMSTQDSRKEKVPDLDLDNILMSLKRFKRFSEAFLSSALRKSSAKLYSDDHIFDFWNRIQLLKTELPTCLQFRNVMFLQFAPDHFKFQHSLELFGKEIYDQMSYFLYDTLSIKELHKKYIKDVRLTDVLEQKERIDLKEMSLYNSLVDRLPNEVLTVPLILDFIVAQVCEFDLFSSIDHLEEQQVQADNVSLVSYVESNIEEASHSFVQILQELNYKYDLSYSVQETTLGQESDIDSVETILSCKIRKVLKHLDDIGIKTYHISPNNQLLTRTKKLLMTAWLNQVSLMFQSSHLEGHLSKFCSAIIKTAQEVGNPQLFFYIYLLVINSILNQLLCQQTTASEKPDLSGSKCLLDYIKESFHGDGILGSRLSSSTLNISSSSSTVSLYDIRNEFLSSGILFVEELGADIMVQQLQAMFEFYKKFEVRRCSNANQVIVVFHNIFPSEKNLLEENQIGVLRTHIPIRDFVEYILEEEKLWLESRGCSFDGSDGAELLTIVLANDSETSAVGLQFTDNQFISFRSLKYETILKLQMKVGKSSPKKSSTKSTKEEKSIKTKDSKRSEKASKKKKVSIKLPPEVKELETEISFDNKHFNFIGYDLGDPMRFQYNAVSTNKFFEDGSRLILNSLKKVYGERTDSVVIYIHDNSLHFTVKKLENLHLNPFHMVLSSGIILGFSPAHSIVSSVISLNLDKLDDVQNQRSPLGSVNISDKSSIFHPSSGVKESKIKECFCETKFTYNLQLSLPSSLHVELVCDRGLFYIRQTILTKGALAKSVMNETHRCYLTDGYVLKYMTDGTIDVLSGNGTIYPIVEVEDDKDEVLRETLDKQDSEKSEKEKVSVKPEVLLTTHGFDKIEDNKYSVKFKKYNVTTSDGKRMRILGDSDTEVLTDLFISSSVDVGNNCINSERLDGVKTTFLYDGTLIVQYTDGTRITSTPFLAEEVFCEWSPDDFTRWFCSSSSTSGGSFKSSASEKNSNVSIQSNKYNDALSSQVSDSVLKVDTDNVGDTQSMKTLSNQIDEEISLKQKSFVKLNYSEDGFVVYCINYLMEHPNYASVRANHQLCEVNINLPHDTSITLRHDGSYTAEFNGGVLKVEGHEVYFCNVNNKGTIVRTIILNTSSEENKTSDCINVDYSKNSFLPCIESPKFHSYLRQGSLNPSILIYTVDGEGNELLVDKKLNINELFTSKHLQFSGDKFSCFVLNSDLSGFKFVSDREKSETVETVEQNNGIVMDLESDHKSVFTCVPSVMNESEKWLMKYEKDISACDIKKDKGPLPSTFGPQESWFFPFEERVIVVPSPTEYDTVIVRLLHKIPTDQLVLEHMNNALEMFMTQEISKAALQATLNIRSTLDVDQMINEPTILYRVVHNEEERRKRENDKYRTHLRSKFVHSVVNKAVISARKARRKNMEIALKTELKEKIIPPYHSSCVGQVHGILDYVLRGIGSFKEVSSVSSFERIKTIIDELLSLIFVSSSKHSLNDEETADVCDDCRREMEILGMKEVVSEIFGNFCDVARLNSYQNLINSILDKSLDQVSAEDIEILCGCFKSDSNICPFLDEEDFILEDVLEARTQLSHYFKTLRSMLEYYRGRFIEDLSTTIDGGSILHSLTAGAQLALEHCQQEFQWERWNCPDSVFSRKGRQLLTKETAFVSAITAAGIIYSITRNCSRGQLSGCGCRNTTRAGTVYGNASFPVTCLDNLVYAEKVAAEFLENLERDSRDSTAAVNLHNFIVGKEAVRATLHQECKCQGLSSFCPNKACNMRVGPFQDITTMLRHSYKMAKKVDWNSVVTDPEMLSSDQLLYLSDSPDYCLPNNTTGWPGTLGRTCLRGKNTDAGAKGRRSCKNLCRACGHVVRRRQRKVTYQCQCRFHWCCKVTCQECTKVVQQNFCDKAQDSNEM